MRADATSHPRLVRVLERLSDLIDWERRQRGSPQPGVLPRAMREDVEPARDLLARLGHPERRFRAVHVAGTKGKGSVSALVEAGLTAAGVQAGRYGSPHVERVNERVTLAGRAIGDLALAEGLERALAARDEALAAGTRGAGATWFDVVTAGGFFALAEAGAAWAVVECGLGGRLDSTNALDGEVCVVTNIDLEHTELLGTTRAAIAAEKAGILAPGCEVVTGLGEGAVDPAGAVLDEVARSLGVRVHRTTGGGGTLEERNARLAGLVLDRMGALGIRGGTGRPVGAELLTEAVRRSARLPGRLERALYLGPPDASGAPGDGAEPATVRPAVPVVLDGAHVVSSLEAVLGELEADPPGAGRPFVVFGTGLDKDAAGLLKVLAGRVDRLFCTPTGGGPHRAPEELLGLARNAGLEAEIAASPRVALDRAAGIASPGGWVLVTGSLHLVGALRPLLRTTAASDAPRGATPC